MLDGFENGVVFDRRDYNVGSATGQLAPPGFDGSPPSLTSTDLLNRTES